MPEADAVLTVLMDCIKAGSIDIATVCTFHLPSTLIKTVELLLEASRSRRSLQWLDTHRLGRMPTRPAGTRMAVGVGHLGDITAHGRPALLDRQWPCLCDSLHTTCCAGHEWRSRVCFALAACCMLRCG